MHICCDDDHHSGYCREYLGESFTNSFVPTKDLKEHIKDLKIKEGQLEKAIQKIRLKRVIINQSINLHAGNEYQIQINICM